MVDRIVILSTLNLFNKNRSPVDFERVRHGRIILSLFKEDLVSPDEYNLLIDSLSEEEYIDIYGYLNDDRNIDACKISVTREGEALFHALGEKTIGEADFKRLEQLIGDYLSST